MKVLLLDPTNVYAERLRDLSCTIEEITILDAEKTGVHPSDTAGIDVIVGGADSSSPSKWQDLLLDWRTHPHTYLVPSWIASEIKAFEQVCAWPRLAVDCFNEQLEPQAFCDWLNAVAEWHQDRMHFAESDSFRARSTLELATSLDLRRATGKLSIFDDNYNEGTLTFRDGHLTGAAVKHLRGEEAFYEFLSWVNGSYHWTPGEAPLAMDEPRPIRQLIHEGLRLIRDANLLYHFVPDLHQVVVRTDSESALDDGAVPFYSSLIETYNLIDGTLSISGIMGASPLSRLRTMSCMAKWFSLGDIALASTDQLAPVHRLLIVDDSQLMCNALHELFSRDPRFQIVGTAHDGIEALKLIERHNPDVVTLDLQMPRMDGLTTLKHIMIRDPKPVVILSAFTKDTSQLTYETFKYGTVDVFTKPSHGNSEQMEKEAAELRDRVAQASCFRMGAAQYIRRNGKNRNLQKEPALCSSTGPDLIEPDPYCIVINCGAGGFPSLLKFLLAVTKSDRIPYVITNMAMPKRVVEALVPNLKRDCEIEVEELPLNSALKKGVFYLCSHDHHFQLVKEGDQFVVKKLTKLSGKYGPLDCLLFSAAAVFEERAAAIVISGAGNDGLAGMERIQQVKGLTYVLSPEACLKPDLPRSILERGYAQEVMTTAELACLLDDFPRPLSEIRRDSETRSLTAARQ